jgi:hypothetical protein
MPPKGAKAAQVAEATNTNEIIEFEYDGLKYDIDPSRFTDVVVMEALADDKLLPLIRGLVGANGWKRFNLKPRKVEDLVQFGEKLFEAFGVSLGESSG